MWRHCLWLWRFCLHCLAIEDDCATMFRNAVNYSRKSTVSLFRTTWLLLSYHKSHFVCHWCNVTATGSWSNDFENRNALSNGQLGKGISVFVDMSTPTLGPTQPSLTGTGSTIPKSKRPDLEDENNFSVRSEIKSCSSLYRSSSV